MDNVEVARIFEEVADLLELQEENPFRVRAYRAAARTLRTLGRPVAALVEEEALAELPGIGKDLAGKIAEIVRTGDLGLRRQLAGRTPESLAQLMRVPGVGPRRARLIYDALGVRTVAELEEAARAGRLETVRGIGARLAAQIRKGCAEQQARSRRRLLAEADAHIAPLLVHLRGTPGLATLAVVGSTRRRKETVGDVDLLAAASRGRAVAERFLGYPAIREVLAHGDTKCSVVLRSGLQVDLRIVPPASFGAALHSFTGSKAHNIAVRTLALRRGLKINEYGVFRGARRIAGRTEEEVYRAVGLPWIPPELREDQGELEAARAGRLPRLVTPEDLRGDLHIHTDYTDGVHSLAEMVEACRARGYEYVAITDHSQAVRVAGGLDGAALRRQACEIDQLRGRVRDLVILKGAEVDILADGRLDLDDQTLAELDLVLVAVHSGFNMPEARMTERVLRALRHPRVHVLSHPTGRLLLRREPYAIDMEQVIRAARELGVLLEIDAQPDRLDLSEVHARMARDAGVKVVISSDAHRTQELGNIRYGVDQARRGSCTAEDVANTRPYAELERLLAARAGPRRPAGAPAGSAGQHHRRLGA